MSISDRSPCRTFDEVIERFERAFIQRIEAQRPDLRGEVDDKVLLSAVVEALGYERGVALLEEAAQHSVRAVAVETFLERLREGGFTPQRVFFATRRYRRWLDATPARRSRRRARCSASCGAPTASPRSRRPGPTRGSASSAAPCSPARAPSSGARSTGS